MLFLMSEAAVIPPFRFRYCLAALVVRIAPGLPKMMGTAQRLEIVVGVVIAGDDVIDVGGPRLAAVAGDGPSAAVAVALQDPLPDLRPVRREALLAVGAEPVRHDGSPPRARLRVSRYRH